MAGLGSEPGGQWNAYTVHYLSERGLDGLRTRTVYAAGREKPMREHGCEQCGEVVRDHELPSVQRRPHLGRAHELKSGARARAQMQARIGAGGL